MKGRPKSIRKISSIPAVSGFEPFGGVADSREKEAVFLLYEEYEALRLNDYEKNSQCESAIFMGVSRPTFTRIYISAREKIAKAFVEGRKIIVEGGKVEFDDKWFVCEDCGAVFSEERAGETPKVCALCGSASVCRYCLTDEIRAGNSRGKGICRRQYGKGRYRGKNE